MQVPGPLSLSLGDRHAHDQTDGLSRYNLVEALHVVALHSAGESQLNLTIVTAPFLISQEKAPLIWAGMKCMPAKSHKD